MSRREKREQEEREAKERKKREKEEKKAEKKAGNKKERKDKKEPKNKKGKKKSNIFVRIIKTILKVLLILILLIILLLGCFVGWLGFKYDWNFKNMVKGGAKEIALMATGQTEEDIANLAPIYCLVLGVSTDEGNILTDTIILCAYYPKTQEVSMLSIPRDTFVGKSEVTAGGYDKINASYQRGGGGDAGAIKVLNEVEKLTGLDINNYLVVKNEGLIKTVDAIGGVEFNVPINMNYDDDGQDLHIHLTKGLQRLNGDKAEQLLRFRHNNDGTSYPSEYGDNDIGRMRTQREFIMETAKQTLQAKNITKINQLIEIVFSNVETNMDMDYVMKYSPAVIDFDVSAIETAYVPGASALFGNNGMGGKVWFYRADKTATKKLVQEMFTFKQQKSEADSNETAVLNPEYIKLQVLNATGDDTSFEKVKDRLKNKGYKIENIGTTTISKTTKVINRNEKKEEVVDELVNTLGYGNISEGKKALDYDITIIVGQDMNQVVYE